VTPSATAPEGPPSRWSRLSPQHDTGLVAYLAALSGLSALGIDLVLPALGDVRSHFDLAPDATDVSLVVTTYIFGMGIGQVFYGPLADRFGRRPTVLGGLALYVAAAIGSALAPSLPAMLACRAVMGLGAASPRAMSLTIARDRFSGDAMTRVVSTVMMFFQLSPAVAPLLGQGLLVIGPWQLTFLFTAAVAGLTMLWTRQFAETLPAARRAPLSLDRTRQSARAIVTSRWALGHGLVLTFEFSAFYAYLSSSELIFDDVFGRGDQFAYFFAAGAVFQAAGNLTGAHIVGRIGTSRFIAAVMAAYLAVSLAFAALTAEAGGVPAFWPWVVLLWVVNTLHALVLVSASSLAMQPLGAFAGTGSGVIGTMSIVGGAIMASLVASTIDGTATPLALAYVGFGALAAGALVWARGGSPMPLTAGSVTP
jgi:DHA1 family bicyclomycin/chloramphenicol resistance-like MFS transporter